MTAATVVDERPRALLVCPGRGAYGDTALRTLPASHPWVERAEWLRAEQGLESLLALDGAEAFEPSRHLRPANAGPLTYLATLLDAERAVADYRVVAVIGNSLGWYAALTAAGALEFEDGFRLVQGIALLQEEAVQRGERGGHLIYPRQDANWQPMPEWAAAIEAASGNGERKQRTERIGDRPDEAGDVPDVFPSVDLGSYVILAGTEEGIDRLAASMPPVELGERHYPLRLAFHVPYHTPLQAEIAAAAAERFMDLGWRAPWTTLIDGRGVRFTPWATDPAELAAYTLGPQLVSPFDFGRAIRVGLREYAPAVVVLPGPGATLGGLLGQLVVAEGYRGLRTRADFESAQAGPSPLILSMRH